MSEIEDVELSPSHGQRFIANRRPRRIEAIQLTAENVAEVVAFAEECGVETKPYVSGDCSSVGITDPVNRSLHIFFVGDFIVYDGTRFSQISEAEIAKEYEVTFVKKG